MNYGEKENEIIQFNEETLWRLVSAKIESVLGNKLILRYRGKSIIRDTRPGMTYLFGAGDFQ